MKTPWQRRLMQFCVVMIACIAAPVLAQSEEAPLSLSSGETEIEPPILVSAGLSTGFPGFNRFSVAAALQYRSFGAQVKLAPTAAGMYFGVTLRGYVPVGGFVPIYVGAGGGAYGGSSELHLVLGGHVPVAERVRLDVEAGAARVGGIAGSQWLPWVSLGVSYIFPVSQDSVSTPVSRLGSRRGSGAAAQCTVHGEDSLMVALDRTVEDFINNAAATYSGSYTDLQYDVAVDSVRMGTSSATVALRYSGSVRRLLGGGRESASGTATAQFSWNGCNWRRTALNY